ncbi:MAG: 23S rRNA (guanosine(2251)-2'-O)-methyltransferase RlmB [Candidatus Paceibacterota bacterium]
MTTPLYLYGRGPLEEAITLGKSGLIEKIFLTPQAEADGKIIGLLQKHGLKHERVTVQEIESMTGRDATHQGVCALLDDRKIYTPLDTVLLEAKNSSKRPLFVLLDELQDPHNVGAIIRSALAFGATAVLMPEYDQVQVTSTVIKTSAGTVFSMPIVRIGNVNTTLRNLKEKGFWIYGLAGDGETKLATTAFDADTVIVIGSEGEGIRPKTLEVCDFKLAIDINPACESLNASNAAAVAFYEWYKQQSI